jgi:tetratricopeptide (TPR) repeat protein
LEKARETYEKITSLTGGRDSFGGFLYGVGRFLYGDIFAKSFYMLGKICEQKGQKEKAIENYTKFLDLWKDADLDLLELENARKRLAGLKGN